MMMAGLLSSLLVPFLLALLLGLGQRVEALRTLGLQLAPWAALPALLFALWTQPSVSVHFPWLLLGTDLGLDTSGRLFLGFTAVLWLAAGLYANGYLPDSTRRSRFFIWFLLALTGNLLLILAQEVMSFFLGFAVMSFAAYGLVAHEGSAEAYRAGRLYLLLVIVGEMALFSALVLVSVEGNGLDFSSVRSAIAGAARQDLIIGLLLIGCGIKAGIVGLHVWLPLAHPVAPTPASAVLSGAMIKAGLLGAIRLLPLGEVALSSWGEWILGAGLLSVFYGAAVGITQKNPKTLLAYSSISQMGLMGLGLGAALLAPQHWPLLLGIISLFAVHHGLAKGALFLGVGMASHTTVDRRSRHWVVLGLVLPALALAAAPLTSGMAAKTGLKVGLATTLEPTQAWILSLLPWSSVATTLLMARFLYLLWPEIIKEKSAHGSAGKPWLWIAWGGVLFASSGAVWMLEVSRIPELWTLTTGLANLWPLLLGISLAATAIYLSRSRGWPAGRWQIPPGDLLVPLEYLLRKLPWPALTVTNHHHHSPGHHQGHQEQSHTLSVADASGLSLGISLNIPERILLRWSVALAFFLLLIMVLMLALV
jgi:formate hydrogenlyase subunit 3/multisubunit Na+/H+ antiporter MnhD subunit